MLLIEAKLKISRIMNSDRNRKSSDNDADGIKQILNYHKV